jgi:uncharacterized membrane protein HdeD (DUF308 family)
MRPPVYALNHAISVLQRTYPSWVLVLLLIIGLLLTAHAILAVFTGIRCWTQQRGSDRWAWLGFIAVVPLLGSLCYRYTNIRP